MITKITSIENLAVFRQFNWDKSVLDSKGKIEEFKDINILYGRNYAGKTTLSRIFRALENRRLSDKFQNPNFCLTFKDSSQIRYSELENHDKNIRVFNEDFIRDNLKFIINPDDHIESFAILGDNNNDIEIEIKKIENELGSDEDGKETGLYAQLKIKNEKFIFDKKDYQNLKDKIDGLLNIKATDSKEGIKYQSERFGDQNYTKPKLEADIKKVLNSEMVIIETPENLERLISETTLPIIPVFNKIDLKYISLNQRVKEITEKQVGTSQKIEELVKNVVLQNWVKEGRELHKNKRTECAFCGNKEITANRWQELDNHFDKEFEEFEKNIDLLLNEIDNEINRLTNLFSLNKSLFYSKFHEKIDKLSILFIKISEAYKNSLNLLKKQLIERKNDLVKNIPYNEPFDFTKRIGWLFDIYEQIRVDSNNYCNELKVEQVKAKESLRLKEVSDFVNKINFSGEQIKLLELEQYKKTSQNEKEIIESAILEKKKLIENKRAEMQDEEKGAIKVSEYLNNFFGHSSLSLKAIESDNSSIKKNIHFEVFRAGVKAYHLSEGECSLIAFCYFMAKLDDIRTKGIKPIIWIDDPISSLDSNHIFFTYSLINSEIVSKQIFEQLFISTHNLDFLKYLKRLNFKNTDSKNYKFQNAFFSIHRQDKDSVIQVMPKYLKDFVTEFNYLFDQIYKCSQIEIPDDSNYTIFYNLGNNARKFLEIYLYYKYPGSIDGIDTLQKFFGEQRIPAILTDRINNEYSHLCGTFERGATPVEVPEMTLTAKKILERIKFLDHEQYESLVKSVS
jgi:wobble nucleotide-excising tRNase